MADLLRDIPRPEPYTGIYSMHKYWSKKPFNVVARYIEAYTDPDEIVLDPFAGSGIANTESVRLGRRTVGLDINPMSAFITRQMMAMPDIRAVEGVFVTLRDKMLAIVEDAYAVRRGRNRAFVGTHFIHDRGSLREVWYKDHDGRKVVEAARPGDQRLAGRFAYDDIKTFFPRTSLLKNSRINAQEGMHVHDLFTPRNTFVLSAILSEINRISDGGIRDFFRFCFTSCLGQASRMVFVINNRGKGAGRGDGWGGRSIGPNRAAPRKEVGSWVIGYWIPKEHFEINAWNCFENRYGRILKTKKRYAESYFAAPRYARGFGDLSDPAKGRNILLVTGGCRRVLERMPDSSVDYVITDPPHGDRLPYLELSMMWNSWMGFETTDRMMRDELVVSDAKVRGKTVATYGLMLAGILAEIRRVLRPGRYFTLMFNSYSDATWRGLQDTLFGMPDLEIADVGTVGYSAASVVQDNRKGGLKTDFVLTFKRARTVRGRTRTGRRGATAGNAGEKSPAIKTASDKIITGLITDYVDGDMKGDCPTYLVLNHVITNLFRRRLAFTVSSILDAMPPRTT